MGKLYLVPTPIGNLEDITLRALRLLKEADFIMAEDTRTTSFLLSHYEIKNHLIPFHKFNEHQHVEGYVQRIKESETAVLVSDAGTPGISDPGYLLVRHCLDNDVEVECLPGATAVIPAVVNSGFANDRFCFEGFLPQKKGRQKRLDNVKDETRTMVFYESPFRLVKTLEQFAETFGAERLVCVSRELTKMHEENFRGTMTDAIEHFKSKTVKGEIVIVVNGADD
ncbi:MAG: 16S rRNA (cytidine(1402)-2'-O)-methyltransferase [Salinivirgaceae bacterium]|nr:16S rRNA (cytidine(1402)-2'-O)-methyltransferase [Salinivirgaceae bacterium]